MEESMMDEQPAGRDTATGTDPDAKFEEPGYEDVSLGQAVERDRQFAEELVDETDDIDEAAERFRKESTGAAMLARNEGGDDVGVEDAGHLLAIYLGDHRAAAAAGVEIARRLREQNRGTEFGSGLADIHAQVLDDRDTLEAVADRLGASPARLKSTLGVLAERVGRLKPSGRLRRYSPLSRVLELEALLAGVRAKRHLWDALRFAGAGEALDPGQLDRLIERADSQLDTLQRLHREAALIAFGRHPSVNSDR